jgi:hypothetical protein
MHTPLFREFFLSKQYLDHIIPPKEKDAVPLAKALGDLIRETVVPPA